MNIAIVDDNKEITELMKMVLSNKFNNIVIFDNGDIFSEHPSQYDVVITDLNMPGKLNGYELLKRYHELYPEAKLGLISGDLEPIRNLDQSFINVVLDKPFQIEVLFDLIQAS